MCDLNQDLGVWQGKPLEGQEEIKTKELLAQGLELTLQAVESTQH